MAGRNSLGASSAPHGANPTGGGLPLLLAHDRCNERKSDLLAAEEHLDRWADRNRTLGAELESAFDAAGVRHDLLATERVARWAYRSVHRAGGQVWVRGSEMRALGQGWEGVLPLMHVESVGQR